MPDNNAAGQRFAHPTDHAIVVGINGYQSGIPSLQGCINDAELFHEWLVDPAGGGLDPVNVHLITGPIHFVGRNGRNDTIPLGPCLIEELSDQVADIVWGQAGEESVVLPMREIESAEQTGKLVLLD